MHQINVAALGFLTTGPLLEGILTTTPIQEGKPKVALPFQHVAKEEATSSQPSIKEREEIVEVSDTEDSEDNFEVLNQPLSLEVSNGDLRSPSSAQLSHNQEAANTFGDMGIQHK